MVTETRIKSYILTCLSRCSRPGLSLHRGNVESRKTLEQKLGTRNPHGIRSTQRENRSKPLQHSIFECILVFKRRYRHVFVP